MDFPTGRAIREIIGSLSGRLPEATYKEIAPLLSDLVALLERAHEEERRQLRAERAALDKEREAANLTRRSLEAEREGLTREREVIEKEKQVAQRWREAQQALDAASESTRRGKASS